MLMLGVDVTVGNQTLGSGEVFWKEVASWLQVGR